MLKTGVSLGEMLDFVAVKMEGIFEADNMKVETLLECTRKYIKEFFVGDCLLFCGSVRTRGNYHQDSGSFGEAAFRCCLFADKGEHMEATWSFSNHHVHSTEVEGIECGAIEAHMQYYNSGHSGSIRCAHHKHNAFSHTELKTVDAKPESDSTTITKEVRQCFEVCINMGSS
jgi:hypothetical protein